MTYILQLFLQIRIIEPMWWTLEETTNLQHEHKMKSTEDIQKVREILVKVWNAREKNSLHSSFYSVIKLSVPLSISPLKKKVLCYFY